MPRPFPAYSQDGKFLPSLDPLGPGVRWWFSSVNSEAFAGLSRAERWENGCNPAYLDSALLRLPNGNWCRCCWEELDERQWVGRIMTARQVASRFGSELTVRVRWQLARDCRREAGAREGKVVRRKATEARDKWIYQQRCKGTADKKILADLKQLCREKGWPLLGTPQGLRDRAAAYAENHHLAPPPPRRGIQ
jgi:hypothetical protein